MRKAALGTLIALVTVLAAGVLGWVGLMWWDSRLPGTYNVMDHGEVDFGGGSEVSTPTTAALLPGIERREPARPARWRARRAASRSRHGRRRSSSPPAGAVDALTFDGRSPGPELRVRQGDLVEVTLVNDDIAQGVTIHWHGVDVPNAEDGVAGVTQDAVLPGERYVYRFRAEQVGTFWYHTHQASSKEVRRGLFGAIVIEPARPDAVRPRPRGPRAHVRRHPDSRCRTTGSIGSTSRRDARPPATCEHRQLACTASR